MIKTNKKFISAVVIVSAVIFGAAIINSTTESNYQNVDHYTGIQHPTSNSSSSTVDSVKATETDAQVEKIGPVVETKTETKQIPIPYETITRDDSTLERGTTRVSQVGVEGLREETYAVTYTDGRETSRELTSSQVIKQPVAKIILNGTYVAPQQPVCQNGTYTNSNGQIVCRPSAQNTGGATAVCRDGTYSYSQSRRGTCSHHGGVRDWL